MVERDLAAMLGFGGASGGQKCVAELVVVLHFESIVRMSFADLKEKSLPELNVVRLAKCTDPNAH